MHEPGILPARWLKRFWPDARRSTLAADLVEVKVDQIMLSRAPTRAFAEALSAGMKKTPVEIAVAYDGACVTEAASAALDAGSPALSFARMLGHGLISRAPASDSRRGPPRALRAPRSPLRDRRSAPRWRGREVGMLSLVVPSGQLGQALAQRVGGYGPRAACRFFLAAGRAPSCARATSPSS